MRLIITLFLTAFATACATPDEAEGWTSDSIDSHESALTRSAATTESASREGARVVEDDVFADVDVLVATAEAAPTRGEEPGDEPVSAKRVPVRVEISRDRIHVEWNDGTSSNYCYNEDWGQYVAC